MAEVFRQPRIITWARLQEVILPKIAGYPWAVGTLWDLWKKCTPTPNQILTPNPGPNETRIINPTQFAKWWGNVQERMGLDVSADEAIPHGRSWA